MLAAYAPAWAAQLGLLWDPSGDSDVVGYNVYYGTQSGHYTTKVNAGNVTSYTVSNLQAGPTYYFASTAYDSYGYESDYSNELIYAVPSGLHVLYFSGESVIRCRWRHGKRERDDGKRLCLDRCEWSLLDVHHLGRKRHGKRRRGLFGSGQHHRVITGPLHQRSQVSHSL